MTNRFKSALHSLTIVAVALFSPLLSTPAEGAPKYQSLPTQYDGSMDVLDLSSYRSIQFPDSLRPIFIDYVARHGARYMSSAKKTENLEKILDSASDSKTISKTGVRFNDLLRSLDESSNLKWGLLSPEGIREQQAIGSFLLEQFPNLCGRGSIHAIASYVPRVVETMYGLTGTLVTSTPSPAELHMATADGTQFDPLLRYFASDSTYMAYLKNGAWKPVYLDFMMRNVPVEPAERLFSKDSGLKPDELKYVTMAMYDVLQSLRCSGLGIPTTEWMTEDEYRKCWETDNLEMYLKRSWTTISNEPARAASPLLTAMIESLDNACLATAGRANSPSAMMRFGHAETLIPLFSLMGLPGCQDLPDDLSQVAQRWQNGAIAPMGSNLILALLRSTGGRFYIMACLNGKWVAPMRDTRLMVPYLEIRSYWNNRMAVAGR